MLDGIDDVDWAAMQHAYGGAADVPLMLRGLLDEDPEVRAGAEDDLWGAVHHQGDVYDSTLATIPFLIEIAAAPGPSQAAAAHLLSSYGGVDPSTLEEDGDAHPWSPSRQEYRQAEERVQAARDLFVGLLDSSEPEVRRAAVLGCLVGAPRASSTAALLDLDSRESDPTVGTTTRAALGWLHRSGAPGMGTWVRRQQESLDPTVRLAALIESLRRGEHASVEAAAGAVEAAYASPSWDDDRARGRLTGLHPEGDVLLLRLLASADVRVVREAVPAAGEHVRRRRGDHVALVSAVAAAYDAAPEAVLRALAVAGPLAAPARATLLAAPLDESVVETLVRLHDPHALPHLAARLRAERPPRDVGFQVARLGPLGSALTPDVLHALRRRGDATAGLLQCVAELGIAEAVPLIEPLLPDQFAIRALRLLGPAAASTASRLRPLLTAEPRVAVAAAHALWAIAYDDAGREVVLQQLEDPADGFSHRAAADAAGEMGLVDAEPALRAALARPDQHGWLHLASARAMWRIGSPIDAVVAGALRRVWTGNESTRLDIAQLLVDLGPHVTPWLDLVRAELEETQRWTTRRGGWASDDVARDEELQTTLRTVLRT